MSKSTANECYRSSGSVSRDYRLKIVHLHGMWAEWIIDKEQADTIHDILKRAEGAKGDMYAIELGLNSAEDVVKIPADLFWNNDIFWAIDKL